MKVLIPGHRYLLTHLRDEGNEALQFHMDPRINGTHMEGTFNQEVTRALIDRVQFLNGQVAASENLQIIFHYRMALALHETRAIRRQVEEGFAIESLPINERGHIV